MPPLIVHSMAAVHLFEPQFQRWVSQARSSSAGPGAPGGPSGPIRGSDPRPLPVTEDRQGGIPPLGFASIGLDFSKQCRFGARASCKVSPWITRACGEKNRVQARGPTFSGQPWRSSEAQCGPDLGYRSISRLVFFFQIQRIAILRGLQKLATLTLIDWTTTATTTSRRRSKPLLTRGEA